MNISLATVFPRLYDQFLDTSLVKRAQEKGAVSFDVVGFTEVCSPKERLDGPTVGHGTGMAIRPEVIERIVDQQEKKYGKAYKIFVTPQGKKLTQKVARHLAQEFERHDHVMFFAGRYEGIDQRAHEEYADYELSIGDYVLMGGDLPVMVTLETVLRYVPGVVKEQESVEKDSFSGPFVDYPTFTVPPREWKGKAIPDVLLSGNHAALEVWRKSFALQRSVLEHFDWVRSCMLSLAEKKAVAATMPEHFIVLMHDQVVANRQGLVGTSSVASLDVHDIARSASTYGIKNYYLVTSLKDQQEIVKTFLGFWSTSGIEYNANRAEAVDRVKLKASLDQVIADIEQKTGKKPLLIATSAKNYPDVASITYFDQQEVWRHNRPVLFIFGTAQGLSVELIKACDYLLGPVEGFSDYNHLSVRSAVAIILDRWMGASPRPT